MFGFLSVGFKEACFLRTQKSENGHPVAMMKSRLNEMYYPLSICMFLCSSL